QRSASPSPSSQLEKLERQLRTHIQRQNYRQALGKLKQIHRSYPEAEISQSESQLWLLQGQQEYDQGDYSQAEVSLRKALNLGHAGEGHYWLAKCLLASEEIEAALTLIQEAFEEKALPKDYAGCYLKLLFLHEDIETIQDLITHHSKRFYAAQLHWARGILALAA
ncbi:tetratricopeptide repeat protein, partial [Acaryochloris marina NIES-2412]|uniref:tetratricopeptide repeat protein n=1 Tax=Acaryochloris marina TaxID=155978 RepID=UPI0040593FA2